ncbi:MAG: zinc ribbon domain-containing protein [Ruminococcaceae bacterium]|nr:zinc ribbon domain-containing protein [Oscillospiraceae bacterium]
MFKKILTFFVVILIVFSFSVSVIAESANTYTDSVTGISFTIPQGWNETALNEEREYIKVKYLHENNDDSSIFFGYSDMWAELPESDKTGYTRSDINHSAIMDNFTKEEILQMIGYDSLGAEINTTYYNQIEYLELALDTEMSIFDVSVNITMITLLRFDNGYCYQFVYSDLDDKSHYQEFKTMMDSVKYKTATQTGDGIISIDSDGNLQFNFSNLILSLVITIVVYSLPIIIYRYGIKKQALPEKKAKKITIIYGIIAFFVMAILLGGAPGGAIILWSFVNYKVLTTPNKNDVGLKYETSNVEINQETTLEKVNDENIETQKNELENDIVFVGGFEVEEFEKTVEKEESVLQFKTVQETKNNTEQVVIEKNVEIINTPKVLFCRKCGTPLLDDSDFCHKCGLRVIKGDIK